MRGFIIWHLFSSPFLPQEENSVQQLIEACIQEEDKLYLCVSSPTIKVTFRNKKTVVTTRFNCALSFNRINRSKFDRGSCQTLISFWMLLCRWIHAKRFLSAAYRVHSKQVGGSFDCNRSKILMERNFWHIFFSTPHTTNPSSGIGIDHGSTLRWGLLRRNRHWSGVEISERSRPCSVQQSAVVHCGHQCPFRPTSARRHW